MEFAIIKKLMDCFNGSFINHNNELIINTKANIYFILSDCKTELDLKRKVLEWLSRASFKTQYFTNSKKNRELQDWHLDGINEYLGTHFSRDDMETIYIYCGNAIRSKLCEKFILSDYDMKLFDKNTQHKG